MIIIQKKPNLRGHSTCFGTFLWYVWKARNMSEHKMDDSYDDIPKSVSVTKPKHETLMVFVYLLHFKTKILNPFLQKSYITITYKRFWYY